jgi:hypothetical protein
VINPPQKLHDHGLLGQKISLQLHSSVEIRTKKQCLQHIAKFLMTTNSSQLEELVQEADKVQERKEK